MQTQSNQPPSIKIRRTRQQWRTIVTEFEHSGLGMRTFCEQHGLAYSSFAKWRSLLKRENNDPKTQPVSFIQLPETAVKIIDYRL